MQADLSFAADLAPKREGKVSEKKSALYTKILKDHNVTQPKTPAKLYDIPSLPQPASSAKPTPSKLKLT